VPGYPIATELVLLWVIAVFAIAVEGKNRKRWGENAHALEPKQPQIRKDIQHLVCLIHDFGCAVSEENFLVAVIRDKHVADFVDVSHVGNQVANPIQEIFEPLGVHG
jgi:hypothetical protein